MYCCETSFSANFSVWFPFLGFLKVSVSRGLPPKHILDSIPLGANGKGAQTVNRDLRGATACNNNIDFIVIQLAAL